MKIRQYLGLTALISGLALVLTVVTLSICLVRQALPFGVVDMQIVISKTASQVKDANPQQLKTISERIKSSIKDYSAKHKLVLFSKGAVLSDLPDYTEEILEELTND